MENKNEDKNKDFGEFLNEIEDYINSYDFFPNKQKVNTYLLEMPALLSAYLDSFENNDDIKEFLRGYQKSRSNENKELIPGEVKQYTLILMDFVIEQTKAYLENKGVEYVDYEDYEEANEELYQYPDSIMFYKLLKEIQDYIEGPFFFVDKRVVDQKLLFLPEFLIEYLDSFQDSKNIKEYLDEIISAKGLFDKSIELERQRYMVKLYDTIITVIERELEENKVPEIVDESSLKQMNLPELQEKLDSAVSSDKFELAAEIRDEISKRQEKSN